MRVAITHTRYVFKGGVERYVYDLVLRLLDAGHEVHYFCHFWDEHVDPRVHLHRIPNPFKPVRFMKVWSYDRWLTKHVRRADWDIVHGFSKSSYQDIYTDGSGCLEDYQAYSIGEAGGGRLGRALRRASLHQRTVLAIERRRFTRGNFLEIVTMSDLVKEQIQARYALSDDEVVTLYNGVDLERFHPMQQRTEHRERLGLSRDAFVVLCVGNDYRRKGVPALIEAARIVEEGGGLSGGRELVFCVVGKEHARRVSELEALARAKGVQHRVRLLGARDEIEQWHALADLFVLPTRFDAFGNVVLEALAAGVPVLVSSKAGAAEVVQEGATGWVLADPDDAATIARRVKQLAADEGLRRKMARAARASAETYGWDAHFARMLELYAETLAIKKARPLAASSR